MVPLSDDVQLGMVVLRMGGVCFWRWKLLEYAITYRFAPEYLAKNIIRLEYTDE